MHAVTTKPFIQRSSVTLQHPHRIIAITNYLVATLSVASGFSA